MLSNALHPGDDQPRWAFAAGPKAHPLAAWLGSAVVVLLVAVGLLFSSAAWAKSGAPAHAGGKDAEAEAAAAEILKGGRAGEVDTTLARLTDKQARDALRLLGQELARQKARETRIQGITVVDEVGIALSKTGDAWAELSAVLQRKLNDIRASGQSVEGRLGLIALVVCGVTGLALMLAARHWGRWRGMADAAKIAGQSGIVSRLTVDAGGAIALIVGWSLARWLQGPFEGEAKALLPVALQAALMVLVPVVIARTFLHREPKGQRPLPLDDGAARDLFLVVTVVCGVMAALFLLAQTLFILGVPRDTAGIVGASGSPLVWLCVGWLGWRYRAAAVGSISYVLGADERWRGTLARAWMPVLTLFLVVTWVLAFLAVVRQESAIALKVLLTFALPILVVACGAMARRGVDRAVSRATAPPASPDVLIGDEALPAPAPTGAPAGPGAEPLMRAIWLTLGLGAIVAMGYLWGLRADQFGLGGQVLAVLTELVGLALIGYIVWGLIGFWVVLLQARLVAGEGSRHAQRSMTLLPLFRKFLQIVVFTLGVMIGLSAIGFDIGPLLASAGVIGIAIGLGAQSTISDILAGVFFLFEDAFRVGDYVEVGNIRGTVEGISLRSLRLRHHRGAVHILPFGQIKSLTNTSRDWMLIRLEFRIAPDSDLQRIKKIIKGIGTELQNDPQFAGEFIVPVKSQGVRRIEDNALVIGIKYIAKPTPKIWMIRREAYQRIRDAFHHAGIRIVGREVTVRVDQEDVGLQQAGAAAAQAITPGKAAASA